MNIKALRILVAEDQNFQRKAVVHMLNSLGIENVLQAGNGKQALEILQREQAQPMDIVLSDLDMPEMDGMEFIRHLVKQHLGISIIIMSSMDSSLIASVEKMARSYGHKLLGAVEKPLFPEQLKKLLVLHQQAQKRTAPATASVASFTLEEVLQAVRERQIEPFLQPKVMLKTGRLIGAEALARWIHPEHGVTGPHAFIPLLEQSGNMEELTFLMLEKTAGACRMLLDKGHTLALSINLSLSSLGDTTLAERITQVVRRAGVDPHHIILEVTESAAMTNVAHALENLARLRMRGFGLSIDDYGTGFSSMQQLTRVPFSELKIDRSFVTDCTVNHSSHVIVDSSIDMARKLNVKSVAEGVETQEEWDMLKNMNCDVGQGYFIAKPMDSAAFLNFCADYAPAQQEATHKIGHA
ncbi:MAG: diguanylate phosphodiesterase [Gallionellales bacterium RIFCSPHIGHO2_02_FULL_57_16]|nr:MAG: diguanylate phosphodiesterase [Gallionellales bacterium RIFCSPHIGHO2_02_FULL_57_16]